MILSRIRIRILTIIASIGLVFVAIGYADEALAKPQSFDSLVRAAAKAFESANYDEALSKFQSAYALKPTASLLYNIGRAYEAKADFPNAVTYYARFVSSPDVEHSARSDAMDRIRTLNEVMALQRGMGGAAAAPSVASASAPASAPASAGRAPAGGGGGGGCVDINTAGADGLTSLPGVGPSKASAILDYRNAKGQFRSVDELSNVKGFGPATISKLRDGVCPIAANQPSLANQAAQPAPEVKPAPKAAPQPASGNIIDL